MCGVYLIGLCEQEQAAVIEGAAGVEPEPLKDSVRVEPELSKDTQVCVMFV